jgi:hypothetical protein
LIDCTYIEFVVTEHCLAREVYSATAQTLSSASGDISTSALDMSRHFLDPDGAYWLIEPMRYSLPKRYSGTMAHHTQGRSKDALTISAFAHFVFIHTGKSLVIADIQGM